MATGTGNLPNQNMDFVPLAELPASDLDKLVENIESLADGSGIGDGAIPAGKLADGGIKGESIRIQKTTAQPINQNTNYTLTFQTAISGYDTSLFELNSNGIKILSNKIKTVLVTVNCQLSHNHKMILYVVNNSTQIAALASGEIGNGQIASIVVPVVQNDIITGHVYDLTGNSSVTDSGHWNFMTAIVLATN